MVSPQALGLRNIYSAKWCDDIGKTVRATVGLPAHEESLDIR